MIIIPVPVSTVPVKLASQSRFSHQTLCGTYPARKQIKLLPSKIKIKNKMPSQKHSVADTPIVVTVKCTFYMKKLDLKIWHTNLFPKCVWEGGGGVVGR